MWIGALIFLAVTGIVAEAPPELPEPVEESMMEFPAGQRQLFLDDSGIEHVEGLTRTMHFPVKRGAVIVPDRAWETALQTRSAPAWDVADQCYKLWLITSTPEPGVAGTTYVESRDGIAWTKPILRQYVYQGSSENNFVAVDPELQWPENAIENVVYDADDPDPDRRYKGFLGCYGRQPMVSPDGVHWRRLAVPEIPSQDESNLSYDRLTHTFVATLKQSGPYGRAHTLSTSTDFEHWTEPELVFHADAEDQELAVERIRARLSNTRLQQTVYNDSAAYNADIYNVGLFRYEGLYVALPSIFHCTGKSPTGDTDGFHLIELACSHDLRTWQRLGDRQTFIGPSPAGEGAFDTMQLLPPSAPVVRGDELWFYYTGIKYRVQPEAADPKAGAICLAVLRRDGFISLDATQERGTVLTKPFVLPGNRMSVNVDATGGVLDVAVLDIAGEVLATSVPITGDRPGIAVRWEEGDLTNLGPRPVRIRFTLRDARLYSFWVGG